MQDWIFMANNFIIVFCLLSNYKMPEEKLYSKLVTLDKQQLYILNRAFPFFLYLLYVTN